MIYNAVQGTTFTATQTFLDDDDTTPLTPKPGYPRVRFYDKENDVIAEYTGNFLEPGKYSISVTVPNLPYEEKEELNLVWVFRDQSNTKYKTTDRVLVEPKNSKRESDLFLVYGEDTKASFTLPLILQDTEVKIGLYRQNSKIATLSPTIVNSADKSTLTVDIPDTITSSLESYLIICKVSKQGYVVDKNFTYKLWMVTPSIVNQISLIDDFVNKSRLENVIKELEYTQGDYMSALTNGLSHFNGIGPQLTSFTGLNMQGAIGNAWFLCSCWYLIQAQKLAEGNVAFDFSGQGVSLNVDRTPHLDALLSSLDSRIQDTVIPLKKLLVKAGVVGGDGSQGQNLQGAANSQQAASRLGNLTVINAPTTSFNRGIRWNMR